MFHRNMPCPWLVSGRAEFASKSVCIKCFCFNHFNGPLILFMIVLVETSFIFEVMKASVSEFPRPSPSFLFLQENSQDSAYSYIYGSDLLPEKDAK